MLGLEPYLKDRSFKTSGAVTDTDTSLQESPWV